MKRKVYNIGLTAHKYALPLYLLILFISWSLASFNWYKVIWSIWGDITLLYFGFYMLYWAYVKSWCKWQMSSISGIISFALIDILFYGNYTVIDNGEKIDNPYYIYSVIFVFIVSLCVVIFYMIKEKDPICD